MAEEEADIRFSLWGSASTVNPEVLLLIELRMLYVMVMRGDMLGPISVVSTSLRIARANELRKETKQ